MQQLLLRQPAAGYIACCEAIRDSDQRQSITAIRLPVLGIAGTHDVATPATEGRFIAQRIAGARYVELDASHLSNVELPEAFTEALVQFLTT
jgi:3-oxoadipate enol-lactonase